MSRRTPGRTDTDQVNQWGGLTARTTEGDGCVKSAVRLIRPGPPQPPLDLRLPWRAQESASRPHRLACAINSPDEWVPVDRALIEEVAARVDGEEFPPETWDETTAIGRLVGEPKRLYDPAKINAEQREARATAYLST